MHLAIIDGTGDFLNKNYANSMRHSFCHQMAGRHSGVSFLYQRGPSLEGYRVKDKAEAAVAYLMEKKQQHPQTKLFLSGYSRGASAAIMAAEILSARKIHVDGMFLFDPVARHIYQGGEVIPANVDKAWVAVRSLDPQLVAKYESTNIPLISQLTRNPMRPSFGSTGTKYLGPQGNCHVRHFRGSHGALGGVGWKHVTEDVACQLHVAKWMNHALHSMGLKINLHSFPPVCV